MPADAWRVVAELAALRYGVATRTQAASLGLSARSIRRALGESLLHEPIPGVLCFASHPDTWNQRLAIVTAAGGDHAAVSHRAAARLHGMDAGHDAPLEVTVVRPRRLILPPSRRGDFIVHQTAELPAHDQVEVGGLRVTGLARTLVDLAAVTDDDVVWRALIGLRRRGVNPRWLAETANRLHRPGQAGSKRVLRALQRWNREGTLPDSWFEELLHRIVDDPRLPGVVRQCPIVDERGRLVARTDLGFPSAKLGLEGHSRAFHFGPLREALDEERDLRAATCGWELLYLGWYATKRPTEVVEIIRSIVTRRASLIAKCDI
jgi:hypothetical protein